MASHEAHGILPVPALDPAPHMLLVAAPFYRRIADDMIAGATAALDAIGATYDLVEVPGALEIPTAIRLAAPTGRFDGFVALGCVIRGETTHYDTVCNDSSRAIQLLGLEGISIGNGILTVENMDQAAVRADPNAMNKGGGAAEAALHLIALARRFASGRDRGPARAPEGEILMASAETGKA